MYYFYPKLIFMLHPPISIRKATIEDMTDIHRLVYQLAVYEKAPEEVTTTPDQYRRDFANHVFDCLVAIVDSQIVGIALYFVAYSTWKGPMIYLDDFVVDVRHRGQGIGHQLFDALLLEAKNKNIHRVKWQVLDWNTPAIRFYEKYNASFDKSWWNGTITIEP